MLVHLLKDSSQVEACAVYMIKMKLNTYQYMKKLRWEFDETCERLSAKDNAVRFSTLAKRTAYSHSV